MDISYIEEGVLLAALQELLNKEASGRNMLKTGSKLRKEANRRVARIRNLHRRLGGDGKAWWERLE